MTAAIELPRYRCHKLVHALKIKDVLVNDHNRVVTLIFEDQRYAPIELDNAYNAKHNPHPGGYYVVYADGYRSYSPAAAFESGYTRLDSHDPPPAGLTWGPLPLVERSDGRNMWGPNDALTISLRHATPGHSLAFVCPGQPNRHVVADKDGRATLTVYGHELPHGASDIAAFVVDEGGGPKGSPLQARVILPNGSAKTLHNSDVSGARTNVPDIKVVGNGDMFHLLCKASSQAEGWMKSTKAMETNKGCLVQVTTQQLNADGSYAVAEALAFVPGVVIAPDINGGRRLAAPMPNQSV